MKQKIIEKIHLEMERLQLELEDYTGQYFLLTHIINIEHHIGKFHAYIDILDELTTEKECEDGNYPEWCKLHDRYAGLVEKAMHYINDCYGKLKEA